MDYKYDWLMGNMVQPDLLKEISDFYSAHYGIWGNNFRDTKKRGKQIHLSSDKMKDWLGNDKAEIWTVRANRELMGYAIIEKGVSSTKEAIIWVTQFVVHKDYRNRGIGKELLFSIWGFSNYFSWGLVTANPYAIRALEKATRRRCEPEMIKSNIRKLFNFAKKYVSYIKGTTQKVIDSNTSKVNTNFFVSHSELDEMMDNITDTDKPWKMGDLDEGWEWFAFTFDTQTAIELSQEEIEKMLNASDRVTQEAYGRMLMDSIPHTWARKTKIEIDFIINECGVGKEWDIIDIGCGTGRHAIELGSRGYRVIGVDAVKNLIDAAKKKTTLSNVKFLQGDILQDDLAEFKKTYNCALCLYDVVGSYADNSKNIKIVQNISSLINVGGYMVISVMNLSYTEKIIKHRFKLKESSRALLELKASNTMETTGNVFDPDYLLLDEETKIIYRREIFSSGKNSFPKELIIRDRRFYKEEIEQICVAAGLEIVRSQFVNAGWEKPCTKDTGKEILLICRKA